MSNTLLLNTQPINNFPVSIYGRALKLYFWKKLLFFGSMMIGILLV